MEWGPAGIVRLANRLEPDEREEAPRAQLVLNSAGRSRRQTNVELFLVAASILFAAVIAAREVGAEVREILDRPYQPTGRLEQVLPLRGRWLSLLLNGPRLGAWGLFLFLGVVGVLFVAAMGVASVWSW